MYDEFIAIFMQKIIEKIKKEAHESSSQSTVIEMVPPPIDFRSRTPILEDPREELKSPEPLTSSSIEEKPPSAPTSTAVASTSDSEAKTEATKSDEKLKAQSETKTEQKTTEAKIEKEKTETEKPVPKPLTSDKGKSKISGKSVGGWI